MIGGEQVVVPAGWVGMPAFEAIRAYSPSCSTRISGTLRMLPLLWPTIVVTMIGMPVSISVFASVPPDAS